MLSSLGCNQGPSTLPPARHLSQFKMIEMKIHFPLEDCP
jgi:hypothetical protein